MFDTLHVITLCQCQIDGCGAQTLDTSMKCLIRVRNREEPSRNLPCWRNWRDYRETREEPPAPKLATAPAPKTEGRSSLPSRRAAVEQGDITDDEFEQLLDALDEPDEAAAPVYYR